MSEHGQKADEIFNDKAPNYEKSWSHPADSNRRPTDYEKQSSRCKPNSTGKTAKKISLIILPSPIVMLNDAKEVKPSGNELVL